MLNTKYFLVAVFLLFSGTTFARASDGILRNADGSLRYMDRFAAMAACPAGTHLPSARELAMVAQANGAKRVLDEDQVDPHNLPDGYERIYAYNPNSSKPASFYKDVFYVNGDGYNRPNGDLGKNKFWSSSFGGSSVEDCYFLNGEYGVVESLNSEWLFAVLCVPNR